MSPPGALITVLLLSDGSIGTSFAAWTASDTDTANTFQTDTWESFSVANPGSQTAGAAFNVTITALRHGSTDTSYSGTQTLTFSGPSNSPNSTPPSYPASVTFTAGVGTASITLYDAQSTTLTVTQGVVTGTSTSFTVIAATVGLSLSPSSYSLQLQGNFYSYDIVRTATDAYGNADPNASSAITVNLTDSGPGHGAIWSPTSVTIPANGLTSGPALYKNPTHNMSVTLTGTATTSGYSTATISYSVTNSGSNPTVGYTNEAQANSTSAGHSTTTSGSYTSTSGATELILVYRVSNSASSDSVSSITGPFTGVTQVGSVNNFTANAYLRAYQASGNGTSASVTVNFNASFTNTLTVIEVVELSGNNSGPVTQSVASTGTTSPANSSWSNSNAVNGELFFAGAKDNTTQSVTISTPSTGTWSSVTNSGTTGTVGYGVGMFESAAAQASVSSTLSSNQAWGALMIELDHG